MSTQSSNTQTENVGSKVNPTTANVRPVHRIVATIIMLFTLYIGTTGLMIPVGRSAGHRFSRRRN